MRNIFRNAIIDMFGGESKIPESVKKAMVLADYDKGKPLTARRIMAVKAAIDASGTKEARTDGNTATVTLVATAGLTEGSSKGDNFGNVQLTRQMTIDLRPEVPVLTDLKLSQQLLS